MRAGAGVVLEIMALQATRRLRRLGLEYRVASSLVASLYFGAVVLLFSLGLAASTSLPEAWGSVDDALAAAASIAIVLLVMIVRAPFRQLRSALAATRAWWPLAQTGVSVRTFVVARRLCSELAKSGLVFVLLGGFCLGLTLEAQSGASGTSSASLVLVPIGALVLAIIAIDVSRTARMLGCQRRMVWLVAAVGVVSLSAVLCDVIVRAESAQGALGAIDEVLTASPVTLIASVISAAVSLFAVAITWRPLGQVRWSTVSTRLGSSRTTMWSTEPPLPLSPNKALLLVDTRRVLRSASERLRPLVAVAAVTVIAAICLLLYTWAGGVVQLPSDVPFHEGVAVALGLLVYLLSITTTALFSLDSDRRALLLWLSVPGGLSRVARVRAATSTAVLIVASAPFVVATIFALRIQDPAIVSTIAVTVAVAALSSSLATVITSVVWPHLEWEETTEIGSVGVWRLVIGALVPAPILLAAVVSAALPLPQVASTIVACAAVIIAVPAAFLLASPISRRWIRVPVS